VDQRREAAKAVDPCTLRDKTQTGFVSVCKSPDLLQAKRRTTNGIIQKHAIRATVIGHVSPSSTPRVSCKLCAAHAGELL